jgi:hypothetical protein
MADNPLRHPYHPSNRAEVFDFLRESLPADTSARVITQWGWKYESSPLNPPQAATIDLIRIGSKLVSIVGGFRLKMWMGGIECLAEGRGLWLVHPSHRGHQLWRRLGQTLPDDVTILFGWSMLPARPVNSIGWTTASLTPLLRVLDAGPLIGQLTHSRRLASIGRSVSAAARAASAPFRSTGNNRSDTLVRLSAFDHRADALWKRARRATKAMVVRDRRYLNWRYCERPDTGYSLYGVERGTELAGFLVGRTDTLRGLRWGYLVDFLAAENESDVLSSLVEEALDDFRRHGIAAVSCYATDPAVRRVLFRRGFFPVPKRTPMHFNRFIRADRSDLRKFATLREWSVTMGDGDFEMAF